MISPDTQRIIEDVRRIFGPDVRIIEVRRMIKVRMPTITWDLPPPRCPPGRCKGWCLA